MKITKVADFPLVEVEWLDADFDFGAEASVDNLGEFSGEDAIVEDAGFLISCDEKVLILATSRLRGDDTIRHRTSIPYPLVREVRFQETKECLTKEALLKRMISSSATPKKTKRRG